MWDCLVKLSTWAEGNSGQIQIVVAVAALFFAYKAYLGLMIQLTHSNEQENVANEQRYFELYIKIISEYGEIYYLTRKTVTKYQDIIADYELFLREIIKKNSNDPLKSSVHEWIKTLKEQEIKVRSMEIEIKDLMGEFKESEGGDIDSIQLILKKLIPLNSNLGRVGETPDRMRINLRKLKAKLS